MTRRHHSKVLLAAVLSLLLQLVASRWRLGPRLGIFALGYVTLGYFKQEAAHAIRTLLHILRVHLGRNLTLQLVDLG